MFDACLWYADGRVAVERVRFVPGPSGWDALVDDRPASDGISVIVCGQRLVERGVAADPYADADSREARSFPDLRHLIVNPYVLLRSQATLAPVVDEHGTPVRRDFGLDQLLRDDDRRRRAI